MPTNTYVALRTQTVAIATNTVTFDLTGISGYTDLIVEINGAVDTGTGNVLMRFNGDTEGNYSYSFLTGNGGVASIGHANNINQMMLNYYGYMDTTFRTNLSVDISNFANTNVFKTILSRANNSDNGTSVNAGVWRNTGAITSVTLITGSNNFAVGTTFSLYGIASEGTTPAPKATGGAIYSDADYYYHVFGSTGTFTPTQSLSADVLCVAGGGGAGAYRSGGGGAGGLLAFTSQSLSATGYSVTVGAGGAGATSSTGTNGVNSQFASLTASVGGGGGGSGNGPGTGANGGSGGGGTGFYGDKDGGTGTLGQGFAGGTGSDTNPYPSGGGGGAGAVGGTYSGNIAGTGGIGATSALINAIGAATGSGELWNSNYYFAGGGGGGVYVTAGTPGAGGKGGGATGAPANGSATAGRANTGGGGGGSGSAPAGGSDTGGAGGSGIVVIRYAKV
jgi:hypothetical protein